MISSPGQPVAPEPARARRLLLILPLAAFCALALLFFLKITDSGNPATLPSALRGRPVPDFALPSLAGSEHPGLSTADVKAGRVSLVNVWASWCIPCRDEHPMLMALAQSPDFDLYGINNKDNAETARRFLGQLGNPFKRIGSDSNGRVSIDWGVYGVPETFVVDGTGTITLRHVGPLSPDIIDKVILQAIAAAAQR